MKLFRPVLQLSNIVIVRHTLRGGQINVYLLLIYNLPELIDRVKHPLMLNLDPLYILLL
jgi:hypothetical protein